MTINEAAQILGIPVNATAAQLRTAFRKLAKKWHPDANPNDKHAAEMMKKINEAHAVFQDYLKNNNNQNNNTGTNNNTGHRPGNNSTNNSANNGYRRPGNNANSDNAHTSHQQYYDNVMQSVLRDLLNRYEKAKLEYEAAKLKLQKAYDTKVSLQQYVDRQKVIYDKSPTPENYAKLVDVVVKANKGEIDHRTAKYHFAMAKLLRDSLEKQYNITINDYRNHTNERI